MRLIVQSNNSRRHGLLLTFECDRSAAPLPNRDKRRIPGLLIIGTVNVGLRTASIREFLFMMRRNIDDGGSRSPDY